MVSRCSVLMPGTSTLTLAHFLILNLQAFKPVSNPCNRLRITQSRVVELSQKKRSSPRRLCDDVHVVNGRQLICHDHENTALGQSYAATLQNTKQRQWLSYGALILGRCYKGKFQCQLSNTTPCPCADMLPCDER
jgi:hypothetical protein